MAKAQFKARRAPADTVVTYHGVDGRAHHLRADSKGLVQPRNAEDDEVLARFGYGHASEQRPARSTRRKAPRKAQRQPAQQPQATTTTSDAADKGSTSGSE